MIICIGYRSPQKDCCWRLTFRQFVRKPSSELVIDFSLKSTAWLDNRVITDPYNDQLPVGLIAQLVEDCTGIRRFESRCTVNVPWWIDIKSSASVPRKDWIQNQCKYWMFDRKELFWNGISTQQSDIMGPWNVNRWFSRYVIAAMLVDENKTSLISSFCSSTSNCTLQHCHLCL